jgi:hypothetical protein
MKSSYTCKQCGKVFTEKYSKYSSGDFCCRKCANTFSSTVKRKEINEKLKEYAKINDKKIIDLYYKNPKYCICCQNIISFENKRNKTCCKECATMLRIKNHPHENDGGYREGSSRGKHGYYKGIWCDSTYELAYLIYCLDHNIDIKRCTETFEYELNGKKHTYHPDFVVEGIITEIKGYDRGDVSIKEMSIGDKEYKLLYYDNIIKEMKYVADTYNKKIYNKGQNNFYELYDDYKPLYILNCDYCGKEIKTNKKSRLKHKNHFCCLYCSGKYRASMKHKK